MKDSFTYLFLFTQSFGLTSAFKLTFYWMLEQSKNYFKLDFIIRKQTLGLPAILFQYRRFTRSNKLIHFCLYAYRTTEQTDNVDQFGFLIQGPGCLPCGLMEKTMILIWQLSEATRFLILVI